MSSNDTCPVCLEGFEKFADHARCDGCFEAVHFTKCSGYSNVLRDGDEHLYIFCVFCYDADSDELTAFQGEDGYYHPYPDDLKAYMEEIDWSDFEDDEGLEDDRS